MKLAMICLRPMSGCVKLMRNRGSARPHMFKVMSTRPGRRIPRFECKGRGLLPSLLKQGVGLTEERESVTRANIGQ